MFIFPQDGADATIYLWLYQDNSGSEPGEPATGLTSASTGIGLAYVRPRGTAQTQALSNLTNADDAHSDGGMKEVDSTNMPGLYRFDLPDAAIAGGENFVVVTVKADAIVPRTETVLLDPMPSVVRGSVNDASATATAFVSDLTETQDDQFIDAFCLGITGANAGAVEKITDYDGTTKTITTDAFPNSWGNGDKFVIINR